MKNDKHWADPLDGPHQRPVIDLDRRGWCLIAAVLLVVCIAEVVLFMVATA